MAKKTVDQESKMFFCVKCKKKVKVSEYKVKHRLKNGCNQLSGKCPECNNNVSTIEGKEGGGLGNKILNLKLPEFHLSYPNGEQVEGGSFNNQNKYSYCGPFTKLEKRLNEGYQGVNRLDKACRNHDIAYHNNTDSGTRNKYDDILAKEAASLLDDPSVSENEKNDARKVVAAMATKSWLKV